tara:strand:+ start:1335 stop:1538 length:204 start_codon:yes stop_codon:yes gene_type:complete
MSIKTKVKKSVELVSFTDCSSAFMRMPWANGLCDWYELAINDAGWMLITGKYHDELEAHWYDSKGGY